MQCLKQFFIDFHMIEILIVGSDSVEYIMVHRHVVKVLIEASQRFGAFPSFPFVQREGTGIQEQAGDSSGGGTLANASWLLIQFSAYIVAGVAGGIAARLAAERPTQTGILAALIGYTLLLVPAILTGRQSLASAVIAFVMFALFAWLGAIIGAHRTVKRGT